MTKTLQRNFLLPLLLLIASGTILSLVASYAAYYHYQPLTPQADTLSPFIASVILIWIVQLSVLFLLIRKLFQTRIASRINMIRNAISGYTQNNVIPKNDNIGPLDELGLLATTIITGIPKYREEQEKFRTIFNATDEPILILDIDDYKIIDCNDAVIEVSGYARDEIIGNSPDMFSILPGEEAKQDIASIIQETLDNNTHTIEWEARRKNNTTFWSEVHLKTIELDGIPRILVVSRNTTDRKIRDTLLHEREQMLYRTQELADVGGWKWDLATNEIRWTPALYRIFGKDPATHTPTPESNTELTHPDDREFLNATIQNSLENGTTTTGQIRIIRPDGEIRHIQFSTEAEKNENGKIIAILGAVHDITPQKIAEQELRNREMFLSQTSNLAHVGGWKWDLATNEIRWTPALYRIFGKDPATYTPTLENNMKLMHPDDRDILDRATRNTLEHGTKTTGQLRTTRPDGEMRHIQFSIEPEKNENGDIIAILGAVHDITPQKIAEQELRNREMFLSQTSNLAHVGGIDHNIQTGEVLWTDEVYKLFGLSKDEFTPTHDSVKEFFYPPDRERMWESFIAPLKTRQPADGIGRVCRPTGEIRWARFFAEPRFADDGTITNVVGAVHDITELKDTETALREQEAILRQTNELAHVGGWELDLSTRTFYFTQELYDFFGVDRSTFQPTEESIRAALHPDDRERIWADVLSPIETKKPIIGTGRVCRPDGAIAWGAYSSELKCDENGTPTHVIGAVVNITELKKIEMDLRAREDSLRRIQDLGHVGGWELDLATRTFYFTEEMYRFFGVDPKTFVPTEETIRAALHPDDRERIWSAVLSPIETGIPIIGTDRAVHPDGTVVWGSYSSELKCDEKGNPTHVIGAVVNVTPLKMVEQDLREREENLRITLQSIGDGVITTDAEGRIHRMNPVAEKITNYTAEEAAGKALDEVFTLLDPHTEQPLPSFIETVIGKGKSISITQPTLLRGKNGHECLIADSGAPIRNERGDVMGIVVVFRDVTEQVKMEEKLRHAQKMDSIGQLAGGVAHDFNNMLGGIIGTAELIQQRIPESDARGRRQLDLIIDTAERAAGLTGKLLAFSRKGKVLSTPIDLHECITDALIILERSIDKRVVVKHSLDATCSAIVGDPSQLQNMILNLGLNARDAMPTGGELCIQTDNVELDEAYCSASQFALVPGQYIRIIVSDTGTGMIKEVEEHIFEPFFTTKEVGKGTGLGLAAVYGSIKDHRGAITVYSEPDKGTSFHIYLPSDRDICITKHFMPQELPHGDATILLIDDEDVIRTSARQMLEELGYRVLEATNGEEGLERYREHQEKIDLVILDMVMPKMNGADCFHAIRNENPDARILMASGFTREHGVSELQEEGLIGFVQKPFRRVDLAMLVAQSLHEE